MPTPHRMFLPGCLVAWLVAAGAPQARAQSVRELTLDESVRMGLEHSPRIRAARADAEAAGAVYRQVRASLLPSVRSQGSWTRLSDNIPEVEFTLPGLDTTFTILPVEVSRYHAEVSIEQPLFAGFRLRNEARAASHQADAAQRALEQEEARVALDVRRAYWSLYQAIALLDAVESSLSQVDEHLRDVQNRLDLGAALTSDLLAARTRRSEVLLERVEAENQVRVGRLGLNRLIGRPLDAPAVPSADVEAELEPLPADLDALASEALDRHPRLLAMEEEVEALRSRLAASYGAWVPEVGLLGRYVYARPNPYFFTDQDRFRGTWELELSMRWSLWDGGRQLAGTSEARARLQAAEARLADARDEVRVDVARQFLEARRAAEAVVVARQNVEQAEETFRVVREQFAAGAVLSAQVLDAEQAYRSAQARRARALADHGVARATLLDALGRVR